MKQSFPGVLTYTPGNPFAYPRINITHRFCYSRGNVHLDWFKQYFCTGEHSQSDLVIFQCAFMFVIVPLLLCFYVQTEMRFRQKQLLVTTPTRWKQGCFKRNLISVSTLKQISGCTSCGLTNIKSNWNVSWFDWKCSPVHKYWLNQSKWTFST